MMNLIKKIKEWYYKVSYKYYYRFKPLSTKLKLLGCGKYTREDFERMAELMDDLSKLTIESNSQYHHRNRGICSIVLTNFTHIKMKIFRELFFMNWPLYSGTPSYPVPHIHFDAEDAYKSPNTGYWKTDSYGLARRMLAKHIAKEIRKLLRT